MRYGAAVFLVLTCCGSAALLTGRSHPSLSSPSQLPLRVGINCQTLPDPRYRAALERAALAWNDAMGRPVFEHFGCVAVEPKSYDAYNLRLFVVAEGKKANWIAWVMVWSDEAGTRFGYMYVDGKKTEKYTSDRLETYMRHELGHILGLGHPADVGRTELMTRILSNVTSHPMPIEAWHVETLKRAWWIQ